MNAETVSAAVSVVGLVGSAIAFVLASSRAKRAGRAADAAEAAAQRARDEMASNTGRIADALERQFGQDVADDYVAHFEAALGPFEIQPMSGDLYRLHNHSTRVMATGIRMSGGTGTDVIAPLETELGPGEVSSEFRIVDAGIRPLDVEIRFNEATKPQYIVVRN